MARPEGVGRVRTTRIDALVQATRRHATRTDASSPRLLRRTLRAMIVCPSCGVESPDGFRFCPGGCATAARAAPTPAPEERKVVTALFCDLVGFTATSEAADPEDVDRMLTAYFAMARSPDRGARRGRREVHRRCRRGRLRRPGRPRGRPRARRPGGAPDRRDEAERLPGLGGAPLRLRVGINTGEALVRLGVAPGSGERFLAGDAINTASRIQSVAPEMGVAVGLGDLRGDAGRSSTTRSSPPATLKGKAEPVRVFHAARSAGPPRGRPHPDPRRPVRRPRDRPRACSRACSTRRVAASSVQLVTVVGEPGIGKSRIVAELLAPRRRPTAPALTWRQGRCLPYGDGVTFWALGEIVKAQAGILESDDPRSPRPRSTTPCPAGPDRDWLRQRLRPLVGVDASSTGRARGAVRRLADVPRDRRRDRPDGPRVRGHPLGRRRHARLPRAPRRPGQGVPLLLVGHGPPGAVRAPRRLRRGPAQRQPDQPRTADRRRDRAARRRAPRCRRAPRAPGADPRSSGGQPPVRRGVRATAA